MVHVRNFTLDKCYLERPEEEIEEKHGGNGFQDNFKNRCRLHRKVNKLNKDASLLDRLNKITERAPLSRYKSRAFGVSTLLAPFSGNI